MVHRLGRADRRVLLSVGLLIWAGLVMVTLAGSVRAGSTAVSISGNDFLPQRITIRAGDTVTWTNEDYVPHDAVAGNESWSTSMLERGDSGSVTFTKAGTIRYVCSLHAFMRGVIVVQSAGGMPATDTLAAGATPSDSSADTHLWALLAGLVGLTVAIRRFGRMGRSPR